MAPFLNAHPAGDFAHRRQQRQPALVVGQRFIGDARRAGCQQAFGQLAVGGEMKIGEDHLPFANQRDLALLRLLHLHDHVGPREDLARALDQLGARLHIIAIGQSRARAGPGLDQHLMPAADEFFDAHRQHRHAIFVLLDLFRHTHDHD